jgi:hypothetical protein
LPAAKGTTKLAVSLARSLPPVRVRVRVRVVRVRVRSRVRVRVVRVGVRGG